MQQRLGMVEVISISSDTASHYADIRMERKRAGTPIPVNDLWTPAVTRQIGLPLLSSDRHFDVVSHRRRISF